MILFSFSGSDFNYAAVLTFQYFTTLPEFIDEIRNYISGLVAEIEKEPEETFEARKTKALTPVVIRTTTILTLLFELHLEHFRRCDDDYQVHIFWYYFYL